tara:strand:+ start:318 stop:548 length:231 start_codon:yes stop_codon:yes gene_type:complete
MITLIYFLLTIFIFSVILMAFYFKLKKLGFNKVNKPIKESIPKSRPWWHYILLPIVGIIAFGIGIMGVRFIFSLFY